MKQRTNLIHQKRKAGEAALGVNVQTASPENIEMAGAAGYDFVLIDCEHGTIYLDKLVELLRAADASGITPIVRVPDHSPSFIMRALDAGAMGVAIPNVNTRAQAEAAVSAAKYNSKQYGTDPFGTRGACPSTRANWHLVGSWPEFTRWSNDETMVWLLIESLEGIGNIDAILEVPGISAIVPGPFDLSQAMGHAGDMRHPDVVKALRTLTTKARAKGVDTVAVLLSNDAAGMKEEIAFWKDLDTTIFWAGGDRRMFTLALRNRMAQVKDNL